MTLSLPLTHSAITDCRAHITEYPDADSVISAYLTRYVNGLMCAEIESVVTGMVRTRLENGCKDHATARFVRSLRRGVVRSATVNEIGDTLGLFGAEYKQRFQQLVNEKVGEQGVERLGVAVHKRNENAHNRPLDVTFRELEGAFGIATEVVQSVGLVLEDEAK